MELSKLCTTCKLIKPLKEFRKQSSTRDGYKYTCKECDNKKQKDLYNKNKEKRIRQALDYKSRQKAEDIKK